MRFHKVYITAENLPMLSANLLADRQLQKKHKQTMQQIYNIFDRRHTVWCPSETKKWNTNFNITVRWKYQLNIAIDTTAMRKLQTFQNMALHVACEPDEHTWGLIKQAQAKNTIKSYEFLTCVSKFVKLGKWKQKLSFYFRIHSPWLQV